ncbi:S-methyl-5-thioribose-1-phosphate isomerase [Mangrovibacillus cuniculi]|uniref:Methylthioribose-1-phosphate isomerase n=1 Tax=Mangrovibacillus cuniculi TaxID=2593652 RepID=A0A7S8HEV9_9BACI|nr:S-methyl-5-thioribose-1-phosphate isomerase [Mangrovibacillus cuniculi]QPC46132.1 S-methyl-5-thioribose-1-phosphate isomerase [Mangrovibacillus cuniculi]
MTTKVSVPLSLKWEEDTLYLLNQQLLPGIVQYENLKTVEQVAEAITSLKVRGAPAIGLAAGFGMSLAALSIQTDDITEAKETLVEAKELLAKTRPTAVNLFWVLDRIEKQIQQAASVEELKTLLIHEAIRLYVEDESVCHRIGEEALKVLPKDKPVLTICNAGSIATAKYGTALAPFHLAAERGEFFSVYACETRPVFQGGRLTTWELMQSGVDVTLITDSMAGHVMREKEIGAVIVGADRIANNGDVANKIGTYTLALCAKAFGIPFYVASPLSTFDRNTLKGEDIVIEERSADEIRTINNTPVAPSNVNVYNPAFDVTPSELITGIITEHGIIYTPSEETLEEFFSLLK